MRHPDVYEAIRLWRQVGEEPRVHLRAQLSGAALDSLDVIDDARAAKMDEEMKRATKGG